MGSRAPRDGARLRRTAPASVQGGSSAPPGYSHPMREGPDFVFEFLRWGTAGVVLVVGISVGLFWLLKRWSERKAREHDKKAGASRRP